MKKYLYNDLHLLEDSHWWHISKRRAVSDCIRNYLKKGDPLILDIGCGTGRNLEQLKKFGKIYGLDNSKEAIKFCKKRGLENIRLGQAEKIPFKSGSFDLVTLLDVLEHTDENKTLNEVYRVLRKDGLLILTVPAFNWLWSRWDEVLHHKRRYSLDNLVRLLRKYSFTITYSTYLYSFLVLPALIIRQIKQKLLKTKKYSSDFKLSTDFLNKIANAISLIEFKIAQKKTIPFGTTILVVAKK